MCPYGTDKYKSTILSRTCYIRLRGAVSALGDRREVPNRSGWPMCGGGRLRRHADYLSALDTGPMLNFRGPEAVTTVRPPRTDAPQSGHSKPTVRRDERAVSKVIGVVLLIAIVIALAAVIAGMVSGFSGQLQEPAPQVAFDVTQHEDVADRSEFHPELSGSGAVLEIRHTAGSQFDPSKAYVILEDPDGVVEEGYWIGGDTGQEIAVSATDALYPYSSTMDNNKVTILWKEGESGSVLFEWEGPDYE